MGTPGKTRALAITFTKALESIWEIQGKGFVESLYRILPRLYAGGISQRQAARELGISVRSLKQYMELTDGKQ
jgi:hypothetical protein